MVEGSNENLQSRGNTEWGLPDPYKESKLSKTHKRTMTMTPQRMPEAKRC